MPLIMPTQFNLPERGWLVRLICDCVSDLTDKEIHARRISAIFLGAALCGRQESAHRDRPQASLNCVGLSSLLEAISEVRAEALQTDDEDPFPLECLPTQCPPTQCPIYIGDERKSIDERTREFSRLSKMMDHVDSHLIGLPPNTPVYCHHPKCMAQSVVLETLSAFKNHTGRVHNIKLRAWLFSIEASEPLGTAEA